MIPGSKLPEGNKHPWLPDELVDTALQKKELDEIRDQAKEFVKAEPGMVSANERMLAELIIKLLKENERKSKVHSIEQRRSLDKLNAAKGE
jgi:hypothetical protein